MAARTKKDEDSTEDVKVEATEVEKTEGDEEVKGEEPKTAEVPEEEARRSLDQERVEVAPAASDDYRKADDFGSEYDDSPLRDTLKDVEKQVYDNVETGEYGKNPGKDNLKQI